MKSGYLSQYFEGVIAKRLSAVETDSHVSNQHEYNGTTAMKNLMGTERRRYNAKFLYLNDDDAPITEDGFLTWYDARENHPVRSEYRFFYSTTAVSQAANKNDSLFICLRPDKTVLVVIAAGNSTIGMQLCWLFNIKAGDRFIVSGNFDNKNNRLEYASRCVLEQLGIEIDEQASNYLDDMLSRFGGKFPATKEFSAYARSTLPESDPRENADAVLLAWLEREEILFRTLEKHLIQDQLTRGFKSVDDFIAYSLSVQNRRKSRVGQALENHFEVILQTLGIRYDRTKITENRSRPDFIFPGIIQYRDPEFPTERLTMLGAKSTCKDRWRQVLAEADRIEHKHLLTLESAISTHQTDEMQNKHLQLVVPEAIHKSYTHQQQAWLMNVKEFLSFVMSQQDTQWMCNGY